MFLRSRSCWAFMGTSSLIWSIMRVATEVSPSWQGSFLSWCSGISNPLATTSITLFKAELGEIFLPAEMRALFTNSPGPSHATQTGPDLVSLHLIPQESTSLFYESGWSLVLLTPFYRGTLFLLQIPCPQFSVTLILHNHIPTHTDKSEKKSIISFIWAAVV